MNLTSKLRIGIVGLGNIVRKAYLSAISELIRRGYPIELTVAYDTSREMLRSFNQWLSEYQLKPHLVENLEELWEYEPHLLIVCTPTHTHYHLVKEALIRGVHVLVEKPFTRYAWQGEELLRLARERSLALMVAHPRRFDPRVVALREVIESGELGDILYLRFSERAALSQRNSWRWNWKLSGGLLMDVGVHYVHLLRWLFGEEFLRSSQSTLRYKYITPTARDKGTPDWIELVLHGSFIAHLEVSWAYPAGISQDAVHIEIYGTHGKLSLRALDDPGVIVKGSTMYRVNYERLYSSPIEAFVREIKAVVESILEGRPKRTYEVTEEALDTIAYLERLEELLEVESSS